MSIPLRHIRNFKAKYHRNGTAGSGFTLCAFDWLDGGKLRPMRAVLFSEPGNCAVFTDDIGERWRGDDFEDALRASVAATEESQADFMYS